MYIYMILGLRWLQSHWNMMKSIDSNCTNQLKHLPDPNPHIHMCSHVLGLRFGKICKGKSKEAFGLKVSYRWYRFWGETSKSPSLGREIAGILRPFDHSKMGVPSELKHGRNWKLMPLILCTQILPFWNLLNWIPRLGHGRGYRSSYDALTMISWFVSACGGWSTTIHCFGLSQNLV